MFDRISVIAYESARIAELADDVVPDVPVPSCPDWSFRDLVTHLGLVQRFWAENVRAADASKPWDDESSLPQPGADLGGWMRTSTEALLQALRDAGDDQPCWTWWGDPRTSGAVARHQVQEAAVHRWDAESAVGTPAPLAAQVAHDGVAEFLEVMLGTAASQVPGTVTFIATDTGGTWQAGGDGRDGAGAATVRAIASDLVLLLYRRLPRSASGFEVEGDVALLDALLAGANTE